MQEAKISSKKPVQTVQLCNEECYNTDNCTHYRYINETKECILATNRKGDYRANCNIRAGPMVRSFSNILFYHCNDAYSDIFWIHKFEVNQRIFQDNDLYDCLVMIQTCDSHLEEECEYSGELVKRFRQGDITGPSECYDQCQIRAPDCKYWIFHDRESECILKRDGRKTCTVRGGPKKPSYDHCKNLTMSSHAL